MRLNRRQRDELVGLVLEQVEQDLVDGNTDAVFALLLAAPARCLHQFLPKPTQEYYSSLLQPVNHTC